MKNLCFKTNALVICTFLLTASAQELFAETIFGSKVPVSEAAADSAPVELGIKFAVKSETYISGLRFYKGAGNNGTHSARLWNSYGRVLSSVRFVNETSSGWQSAMFEGPVKLVPGKIYVASYFAPVGRYAADQETLSMSVSSQSGNIYTVGSGVYRYGSRPGFPSSSYKNTNYYVDIITVSPNVPEPVPQPAPTPAPAPAPAPAPDQAQTTFPNASNTGVPAGTVLAPSGGITVTVAGTVIDARDIRGVLDIRANNVTVKRSRITVGGYVQVRIAPGLTGVVIEDCEINGVGTGNDGSLGIQGAGTFLRNNIYNVENAITPESGSLIQDNYIHDLKASGSPHYDGIQIDGGQSNVVIRHNTIINPNGQTAAIMIDNYFGSINNIRVENNRLVGGGYTVYADAQFTGGPLTGVSFVNNRLGRGYYGYKAITKATVVWTGNVDDVTGQPIP